MTAVRRKDEPAGRSARALRWLPALERELKFRVGWVDEAVSPFAGGRRQEQQAAGKIQTVQTEKAA